MADVFKTIKVTQAVPGGPLQDQLIGAVNASTGVADAGKVVLLNASGLLDPSMGGGGGSSLSVNGSVVTTPNFNGTTPAAPGGFTNVIWQFDGSGNISAYYATSGGSTAFQVNGTPVSSSTTINFQSGTDIAVSNPSAGNVQFAFTGTLPTTFSPVANEFLTSYNASTGLFTAAQPAYSGISGTPQLATTFSPVAGEFLNSYDAVTGLFTAATPSSGGNIYPAMTQPLTASFTFQNQGSATSVDKTNRMVVQIPDSNPSVVARGLFQNIPSAPYTVTLAVSHIGITQTGNGTIVYLTLRDGGGTWVGFGEVFNNLSTTVQVGSFELRRDTWTGDGSNVTSTPIIGTEAVNPSLIWLRLSDDGTNRTLYTSVNGQDWHQVFQELNTTTITPTQIGIAFYNNTGGIAGNPIAVYSVFNWTIANSVLPVIGA